MKYRSPKVIGKVNLLVITNKKKFVACKILVKVMILITQKLITNKPS